MKTFITPIKYTKKQANELTKIINDKHYAQRKEYLNNHSIKDTLILPKKFDK